MANEYGYRGDREQDRQHNQPRYQEGRNDRPQRDQGGRYRSTDYDDPRAEYEHAQGAGPGGQWRQGDVYSRQGYGRDYSQSGDTRGYGMDREYDQDRGRAGQWNAGRSEPHAGRYSGYAAEDVAEHRRDQQGPRRYAQAQYGQDAYGQDAYGQSHDGHGSHGQGTHGEDDRGRSGYDQGSRYGRQGGFAQNAYGQGGEGPGGYQSRQSQRGKGPRNYSRSDERIAEDLNETLAQDDEIDATDITVRVENGEVTLEGTVEQRWLKHRIEDLADRCPGVKDVENRIRIGRADDDAKDESASSAPSNGKSSASANAQSTSARSGQSPGSSRSTNT